MLMQILMHFLLIQVFLNEYKSHYNDLLLLKYAFLFY
jgi:hypothetical protein